MGDHRFPGASRGFPVSVASYPMDGLLFPTRLAKLSIGKYDLTHEFYRTPLLSDGLLVSTGMAKCSSG